MCALEPGGGRARWGTTWGTYYFSRFSPQETKRLLREEFAQEWAAFAVGEADYAWDMLSSPQVVELLGGVMRRLAGKRGGGGGSAPQSKL